jgi:inhibitor of KinA sporulation pathway (predicted exonuclease)
MMTNEAGLQFSGELSERAKRAIACKKFVKLLLDGRRDLDDDDWETILEALELMAGEKK